MGKSLGGFIYYGYTISKYNLVNGIAKMWPELELNEDSSERDQDDAIKSFTHFLQRSHSQLDIHHIGFDEYVNKYALRVIASVRKPGQINLENLNGENLIYSQNWFTLLENLLKSLNVDYRKDEIGWHMQCCFWV